MMVIGTLCSAPAITAAPEPLDAEFLDYLVNCEDKNDNWTVVADEKERRKTTVKSPPKDAPPRQDAIRTPEAKP